MDVLHSWRGRMAVVALLALAGPLGAAPRLPAEGTGGDPFTHLPAARLAVPPRDAHPSPPAHDPPASATERRRLALDELYDRLAAAHDAEEAGAIQERIGHIQEVSTSDTANLLMQRAVTAVAAKDYPTALALLDKLVTLQPRWAEAWNKRATVRYLSDDDVGSMEDISRVLALQPRHFGALSGMGMILHRNGEDRAAMTVLKRAAEVNPRDEGVKTLIEQVTPAAEGTEL